MITTGQLWFVALRSPRLPCNVKERERKREKDCAHALEFVGSAVKRSSDSRNAPNALLVE
jgi:hypothetical protein